MKAVLTSLNRAFLPIYRSRFNFPTLNLSAYSHIHNHCLAVLCKFLGNFRTFWETTSFPGSLILPPGNEVVWERDIFFSKNRLNWGKYEIWNIKDLMDLKNWNFKWRISRRIPNIPLPTWGPHLAVINCLVVFPTHFNPKNSLLIILQISLLFMYNPP